MATSGADQAKIAIFSKKALAIFGRLRKKISPEKKLFLTCSQPGVMGTNMTMAATTSSVLIVAMIKARFFWRASYASRLFNGAAAI